MLENTKWNLDMERPFGKGIDNVLMSVRTIFMDFSLQK